MTQLHLDSVVCAGCACLCDDVAIDLTAGRVGSAKNACPGGEVYLRSLGSSEIRACRRGHEISIEEALSAAGAVLRRAVSPGILGLTDCSLEAIRAAVMLAEVVDGIVAPWPPDPTRDWGRLAPDVGRTWGEIRTCDLIFFWRCNPWQTHPRLVERLQSHGTRLAIVEGVDDSTDKPDQATEYLRIDRKQELSMLRSMRLHGEQGAKLDGDAVRVAELLRDVKKVHVFLGPASVQDEVVAGQWHLLAAHQINKQRISVSALPLTVNGRAVTEAITWWTGYPGPVRFIDGAWVYRPRAWEAEQLLAKDLLDVALCLGACPEFAKDHPLRISFDRQIDAQAEIAFQVPGLAPWLDAHVLRGDGIPLRLAGMHPGTPDPMATLLTQLQEKVREGAG